MYIGFIDYNILGGAVTNEIIFNRLEYQSRMDVDYITANRLHDIDPTVIGQPLQMLMLELIDDSNITFKSNSIAQDHGGAITSMSNDGVSISMTIDKDNKAKRYKLIQKYLPEYSYRGV